MEGPRELPRATRRMARAVAAGAAQTPIRSDRAFPR